MRFLVVFMSGVLLLSVGTVLNAEAPSVASFTRSIAIEIPVKNEFKIGTYLVEANLDSLPAKSEGEIVVKLRNAEAFDLPIKDVTATCGCTRARLMSTLIPANGEAELNIKLRTPDRGPSASFQGQISLHIDKARCDHKGLEKVNVRVQFMVDGLLSFSQKIHNVSFVDDTPVEVALPFVSTVKTAVKDLDIETSGTVDGVAGKIVSLESGYSLILSLDPKLASSAGEIGKIVLRDPASGVTDETVIVSYKSAPVTLSPRTIRFTPSDSDDILIARGVIRALKKPSEELDTKTRAKQDMGKPKPDLPIDVVSEAWIGTHAVKMSVQPLSSHVFRFEMSLDREVWNEMQDQGHEGKVRWRVLSPNVNASDQSAFIVAED